MHHNTSSERAPRSQELNPFLKLYSRRSRSTGSEELNQTRRTSDSKSNPSPPRERNLVDGQPIEPNPIANRLSSWEGISLYPPPLFTDEPGRFVEPSYGVSQEFNTSQVEEASSSHESSLVHTETASARPSMDFSVGCNSSNPIDFSPIEKDRSDMVRNSAPTVSDRDLGQKTCSKSSIPEHTKNIETNSSPTDDDSAASNRLNSIRSLRSSTASLDDETLRSARIAARMSEMKESFAQFVKEVDLKMNSR